MTCKKTIAILGGTFDPIHNGHIETANDIVNWLALDSVYLLPAHIPPHKESTCARPIERKQMLQALCSSNEKFILDGRELNKSTPSYTIETLIELRQNHVNDSICFLIGMDSLLSVNKWHRWQELLSYCHVIVSTRPGYQLSTANNQVKALLEKHLTNDKHLLTSKTHGHIAIREQVNVPVSSTELRVLLKQKDYSEKMQPKAVIDYIKQHKLYL